MIQKKKKEQETGAERRGSVWICAGAIVACLIGSGYATGQEILQFFKSYGKRRRKSAKIIDNIERD